MNKKRAKRYIMLEAKMMVAGETNKALADFLKINESTLFNKRVGINEFTLAELRGIKERFDLTANEINDIFFS